MLTTTPPPEGHSVHLRGWLLVLTLLFAPWVASHAADEASMPPAQTVGEDVIGTPEPMRPDHEYCFSGVLLPTKDNFYTVRDGLLSEYQIKPFKRVRSVALETDLLKQSGLKDCNMWTNHDHSKVIVYNDRFLLLLDAKTGSLVNSKRFPDGMDVISARIDNDEIFILSEPEYYSPGKYEIDDPYQLMVWDINTLEARESIRLRAHAGVERCHGCSPRLLVSNGRVFILSEKATVILERKTFKLDMTIAPSSEQIMLSSDGSTLHFKGKLTLSDHANDKKIEINTPEGMVFFLDLSTRLGRYVENANKNMDGMGFRGVVSSSNRSTNNTYAMNGSLLLYIRCPAVCSEVYTFYQYESGEAIVSKMEVIPGIGREVIGVYLTSNARKYLFMKVDHGLNTPKNEIKIVPINDATFDKFSPKDKVYP